jgi:hypothetical protein
VYMPLIIPEPEQIHQLFIPNSHAVCCKNLSRYVFILSQKHAALSRTKLYYGGVLCCHAL